MFQNLPQSVEALRVDMLSTCISALKLNTFMDNYDAERFSMDGVDRSHQFIARERAYWFNWFMEHQSQLFAALQLLADDDSKRLYLTLVAFRLAGHHSVRIPVDFAEQGPAWDRYRDTEQGQPSKLSLSGQLGGLKHFDFSLDGKRYVVDCLGLKYYLFRRQYFYDKHGVSIGPTEGDHVIDAGACLGDSAVVFAQAVGARGRVYAFDPVAEHIDVLTLNAQQSVGGQIVPMPWGVSDVDHDCPLFRSPIYNPGFRSGSNEVPLRSIDSLVIGGQIPQVDFLKLDVEGAEMAALRGATGTIRKFRPKLALSLYHKPDDLFEIPLFIGKHFPNYRLHLGHYTIHAEETVLYGLHSAAPAAA